MTNNNLLYYEGYENFFNMVNENKNYSEYCQKVFGIDFSQDGFSDIKQVKDLINAANIGRDSIFLDIGCGNGKMAEYISDITGSIAYGFDYSKNAVEHAVKRTKEKEGRLFFSQGTIDEKQYPCNMFDTVLSVDTLYFSSNMAALLERILNWLKTGGTFAAFYSEGHLKEKSADKDSTELAAAMKKRGLTYEAEDYTKRHYELMKHKRRVVQGLKEVFLENNMGWYYDASIGQSIDT